MNRLLISIVALVALVNVGCSVEGTAGGGDDAVGSIQSNLTYTTMSGTWDVIATVGVACSTPGGCDGQAPVSVSTGAGPTMITFPALNLGSYDLSVAGASIGELLPACNSTDAACITAATMPYCIYTGTRTELVGCSYEGHTPDPIPVLAGTSSTATLNFTFHFSDGVERTLFTGGDLVVTLAPTDATSCGVSSDPCAMGELCASIDVAMPMSADLACYSVCYVPDPTLTVPAGGPWGPWTSPCLYPDSCLHVAGLGGTGMFMLGLCIPFGP